MEKLRRLFGLLLVLLMLGAAATAETGAKYAVDGEKTVLIDRPDFCLYLTGEYSAADNMNGVRGNYIIKLNCVIENKSNQLISSVSYDGAVNGWSLGTTCQMGKANNIQPGTKAKSYIWFTTEQTEVTSFEQLESMQLIVQAKNDSYREMFKENTGMVYFHASAPIAAQPELVVESVEKGQTVSSAEPVAADKPIVIYGDYETLEVGSKGDAVKRLQKALIDQGFLKSKADGSYGKATAGGVSKFQESAGMEATGIADEDTQRKLFGGLNVLEALKAEMWYFNGGEDTTLNAMRFTDPAVEITQIVYDGNGVHGGTANAFGYQLDNSKIAVTLFDGSELIIPFAVSGDRLVLDNHTYWSASEVDEALQGYWTDRYTMDVFGPTEYEENVYFGDGVMKYEHANEGLNLRKGEYYYYGPEKGTYKLGVGCFETDMKHGYEFGFNIINGKPVLLHYDRVFESTTKKFPGKNGYKF